MSSTRTSGRLRVLLQVTWRGHRPVPSVDSVPASPPPGSCKAPALTRPTRCALAKQQCSLGGNRACRSRLSRPRPAFLLPGSPASAQPRGGAGARARVTYQLWLSFYAFHTKVLTLFRGATGHSTLPSRPRVVLALAALSGRECHPWLVTTCTRQARRGGVSGTQFRTQKTTFF